MSEELSLFGRVAVVTGASRGIGLAIADMLAAHGASLILSGYSSMSTLENARNEILGRHNTAIDLLVGDIGDPETAAALARLAYSKYRRLDIWVNNAGVLRDGLIGMVSNDDIQATLGTNLAGVLHGTQAAARLMQRAKSGSIINIASIIGRFGNSGQLAYGASKAGVIGATMSAAKELARSNIRVNAIAPGFIDTDMVRKLPQKKYTERMSSISMNRIGTPRDIAHATLFLASDLSTYITGQTLGVDGGMVI